MVLSMKRVIILALLAACGASEEAERLERPVVVDPSGTGPVQNDLGYTITLSDCRSLIADLRFTHGGEAHAQRSLTRWLIGTAWAHPGHGAGGDVRGELSGRFVVDWLEDAPLGRATLLGGRYESLTFSLGVASESDGLTPDDPLAGATHVIAGTAEKDGVSYPFRASIAAEDGVLVEGVPFAVDTAADAFALQLVLTDPFEGDTAFDGIDFATADFSVGAPDHNRLQRVLRSHDHYFATEQ